MRQVGKLEFFVTQQNFFWWKPQDRWTFHLSSGKGSTATLWSGVLRFLSFETTSPSTLQRRWLKATNYLSQFSLTRWPWWTWWPAVLSTLDTTRSKVDPSPRQRLRWRRESSWSSGLPPPKAPRCTAGQLENPPPRWLCWVPGAVGFSSGPQARSQGEQYFDYFLQNWPELWCVFMDCGSGSSRRCW